jgi:hypothetical protein
MAEKNHTDLMLQSIARRLNNQQNDGMLGPQRTGKARQASHGPHGSERVVLNRSDQLQER